MSTISRDEPQTTAPDPIPGRGQHVNWSSIPVERIAEGIERQMVVGENLMICRFRFAPFLVTPEHDHPHEVVRTRCLAGAYKARQASNRPIRQTKECRTFRMLLLSGQADPRSHTKFHEEKVVLLFSVI